MRTATQRQHRRAGRVETDDIDFDDFVRRPLDPATLRCLRYMHDVEHHTICYLRDVLVTDAHRDVEITTFLSMWAFEEYWHGEALGRVLEAHGESSTARVEAHRDSSRLRDRLLPLGTMVASWLSPDVPAVHLSWGAVNEWTTQAAYGLLGAKAGHPTLTTLLGRIMRQEGRHIDFYAGQAAQRLAARRTARRATRWTLAHLWTPVGAGLMPDEEVRFLAGHLFGDAAGGRAAERVDRHIDRLPGLEGLGLLRGARSRFGIDTSVPAASAPPVPAGMAGLVRAA